MGGEGEDGGGGVGEDGGGRGKVKGKCVEEGGRESERERIGGKEMGVGERTGGKGRVEGRRECIIRAQNSFHFGLSIYLNDQHVPLNP